MSNSNVVLLSFCLFVAASAFPSTNILETSDPTAEYIRSLIDLETQRDASRNHDVALIRLEGKCRSEMFNVIIDQILGNKGNNAVYLLSTSDPVPKYQIHAFSFFIIFSDIKNYVRNFSIHKFFIRKLFLKIFEENYSFS